MIRKGDRVVMLSSPDGKTAVTKVATNLAPSTGKLLCKTADGRQCAIGVEAITAQDEVGFLPTTADGEVAAVKPAQTWYKAGEFPVGVDGVFLGYLAEISPGRFWCFATGGAIYQSTDYGVTWSSYGNVGYGTSGAGAFAKFSSTVVVLYGGPSGARLCVSENMGATWTYRKFGTNTSYSEYSYPSVIAALPGTDVGLVYGASSISAGGSLHRTEEGCLDFPESTGPQDAAWVANTSFDPCWAHCIDADTAIAGNGASVLKTTDFMNDDYSTSTDWGAVAGIPSPFQKYTTYDRSAGRVWNFGDFQNVHYSDNALGSISTDTNLDREQTVTYQGDGELIGSSGGWSMQAVNISEFTTFEPMVMSAHAEGDIIQTHLDYEDYFPRFMSSPGLGGRPPTYQYWIPVHLCPISDAPGSFLMLMYRAVSSPGWAIWRNDVGGQDPHYRIA